MNNLSLHHQGTAFLAAGLVANSDKIQSTRYILSLWDEIRNSLIIETRLDYLVALLAQGQLIDRQDIKENLGEYLNDSMRNIRRELIISLTLPILGDKEGSPKLANSYIVRLNDAASAILTASYISVSEKVESSKEILNVWYKIRDMNIVDDNNEYLTALLASSRLNDLRKVIEEGGGLNVITENFRTLLLAMDPNFKVTKIDLAAAHLTFAVVTQTPEIESNGQILELWKSFKQDLTMNNDDLDITVAILTGGIILNRKVKLNMNEISEIFTGIKGRLQEMGFDKAD